MQIDLATILNATVSAFAAISVFGAALLTLGRSRPSGPQPVPVSSRLSLSATIRPIDSRGPR
jgi:hypothetical protein